MFFFFGAQRPTLYQHHVKQVCCFFCYHFHFHLIYSDSVFDFRFSFYSQSCHAKISDTSVAAPAAASDAPVASKSNEKTVVDETPELIAKSTEKLRELLVESANEDHRSEEFLLRFLRW